LVHHVAGDEPRDSFCTSNQMPLTISFGHNDTILPFFGEDFAALGATVLVFG
jgi:hypothetical protein